MLYDAAVAPNIGIMFLAEEIRSKRVFAKRGSHIPVIPVLERMKRETCEF